MTDIPKLILFLLANLLGFFSVGICYVFGLTTGIISADDPAFDIQHFKEFFFKGTMMTWFICAVFSAAYFFARGRMRFLFLWAPVYIPIAYGFTVLFFPPSL